MATRSQKIKVGIFLILGIALVAAVFVLASVRRQKPSTLFHIKFQESVRGLNQDSNVVYQGVPVGKVDDITVNQENEVVVTIGIERGRVTLREGTIATLNITSLMGGTQIELSGGDPRSPELAVGSFIPSQPSILANIASSLPEILADIRNILKKLDRGLSAVKGEKVGDLIRDADQAVQEANRALAQAAEFLRSTRNSVRGTELEISQTMESLRAAVGEVERTSVRLGENPSAIFWGRSKPENPYVK